MTQIEQYRNSWRPWVLLILLFAAHNLSVIDRLIIGLMIEPMKVSLNVTDTEISFIHGFAFMAMYSIIGVPMGLLADRVARGRLIAIGIGLWSLMTAFCGLANSYWMLFLGRVGVGVGEATLGPTAHSLIANSVPPKRLAFAFGIFLLGGITGSGLSLLLGGFLLAALAKLAPITLPLLGVVEPWQAAFFIVGIPGLIVAPLFLAIKEPPRVRASLRAEDRLRLRELRDFYRKHWRTLIPHHVAVGLSNMVLLGSLIWVAPFFSRVHDWPTERIGLLVGSANICSGLLGLLIGGMLSDRLLRYGVRGRLLLCATSMPMAAILAVAYTLAQGGELAVFSFIFFIACCILPYGVAGAALQMIAPDRVRGGVAATFLLINGFVASLGPTVVALLSDQVFPETGGVRYSMLVFGVVGSMLSTVMYLVALKPFRRAAADLQNEEIGGTPRAEATKGSTFPA